MSTHDIRTYGAAGDGATNDAAAIQAAIDACAAAGGGTVLVPAGATFLSGSIVLRSHVELHVERGATLQGSGDWADYTERLVVGALSSGTVRDDSQAAGMFITARDATDVAITGAGVIDGAGRHFITEDLGYIYKCPTQRPFTIFLIGCEHVTLRAVTIRDGALWTVRLSGCRDVLVHGLRIDGDLKMPNCDGIDVDRCRDVRISDCHITCGDDAIVLKATEEFAEYGDCENVTVTNCVVMTTSSGLHLGVDATGSIRNVVFDNCIVRSSHRGLSVSQRLEGDFENILYSNIIIETRLFDTRWWGRGEPIYVAAFPWHDNAVGRIRNVRFLNILARSENGAYIAGYKPELVEGIVLDNVRIELDRWSHWPGGEYDRRPFDAGEGIYAHPTSGIHIDTARDVTVRDCEIAWGQNRPGAFRHALEAINAEGLTIDNLRGESADPAYEAVMVR